MGVVVAGCYHSQPMHCEDDDLVLLLHVVAIRVVINSIAEETQSVLALVVLLELLHGPRHLHSGVVAHVCSISPKQQTDPHEQSDPVP